MASSSSSSRSPSTRMSRVSARERARVASAIRTKASSSASRSSESGTSTSSSSSPSSSPSSWSPSPSRLPTGGSYRGTLGFEKPGGLLPLRLQLAYPTRLGLVLGNQGSDVGAGGVDAGIGELRGDGRHLAGYPPQLGIDARQGGPQRLDRRPATRA